LLRKAIAQRLERGAWSGRVARASSQLYRAISDPVRALTLPRTSHVIGVGGATLGGSCKTPMVMALAREMATEQSVAVVAHGYRGRVGPPRVVEPSDDVAIVGDEALELARALRPSGVAVVIAGQRQLALDLAATRASIVIVDGLLQARPHRLGASILVLDSTRPWGAGRCPPAGDLRASPSALLAACDVVAIGPGPLRLSEEDLDGVCHPLPSTVTFESELAGARTREGQLVRWPELAALRLGVALGVAHPERVLSELSGRGVVPLRVSLAADHGVPRSLAGPPLDAWLTTAKCATKLGDRLGGVPLWVLEHRVALPASFRRSFGAAGPLPPARSVVGFAPCFSGVHYST